MSSPQVPGEAVCGTCRGSGIQPDYSPSPELVRCEDCAPSVEPDEAALGEGIESVLAEHVGEFGSTSTELWCTVCQESFPSGYDRPQALRAHVAAVLFAHVSAAAGDERAAVERFRDDLLNDFGVEWDQDTLLGLQTYSDAYLSEMTPSAAVTKARAEALREAADEVARVRDNNQRSAAGRDFDGLDRAVTLLTALAAKGGDR